MKNENKNNPKVYIILLNYNGWQDTIECMESLLKLDYDNYQIVVVDNASPNDSMNHIIDWVKGNQQIKETKSDLSDLYLPVLKKPLKYVLYTDKDIKEKNISNKDKKNYLVFIQNNVNSGFAAGNNIGMKYALAKNDFEYIWILNNDTLVPTDSLGALADRAEDLSSVEKSKCIIGSKLMYYDNPKIIQAVGGKYNKWFGVSKHIGGFQEDIGQYDNNSIEPEYIVGASMFVHKSFLEVVGMMSEEYFLYYEDIDWNLKAKSTGGKAVFCYKSKVFHKEGSSIGSSSKGKEKSKISDFYSLRSRIILTKKFFKIQIVTVYLGFIIVIINRLFRKQFDRVKMIFKIIFSKNTRTNNYE